MPSENNKRIAKNTLMLYFRMMVTMGISFYTIRVVLNSLGVVDYGLVNVIGSAVTMFSFLSGSLSTAASRFFNFQLGKKDTLELQRTFSMILLLYGGLFVLLLLLSETVGLWVFRTKLVIPPERMEAAAWFFQFTVASLLIGIWSVPYQAMVISHENMRVYALASIFEAFAKLGIVYCVTLGSFDRLKLYGFLLCLVTAVHLTIYKVVCRGNYPETRFVAYFNKKKFKTLLSFSGWNLFGSASHVFSNVMINILLNNYFGVVVNAARGIALQVSNGANVFTQNFLTASRPQIVKYWAQKDNASYHLLVGRVSKLGYGLLLIVVLPVFVEINYLLNLWLKIVPDYAAPFTRIVIVASLIESVSVPISTAVQATGKVALYQALIGVAILVGLIGFWVALASGVPPERSLLVVIAVSSALTIIRIFFYCILTKANIYSFIRSVIVPVLAVTLLSVITPYVLYDKLPESLLRVFLCSIGSAFSVLLGGFVFLLSKKEREKILIMIVNYVRRIVL
ncbi:MAG: polysaccharide biosynthesis protein [Kiritimatiellae bacterium]|nr:polysaccharide biosynthesis protein [Kiritimatiellia bacterium]